MNDKLNALLATLTVEYHKLQNMHWLVKGADFFQAHAQLEALYDALLPSIDEVAETILQLGGTPVASLRNVLATATIAERPATALTSTEAFKLVRDDFQALLDQVKDAKRAADAEENYLVSAQMDGHIASLTKTIWMLRAQAA